MSEIEQEAGKMKAEQGSDASETVNGAGVKPTQPAEETPAESGLPEAGPLKSWICMRRVARSRSFP